MKGKHLNCASGPWTSLPTQHSNKTPRSLSRTGFTQVGLYRFHGLCLLTLFAEFEIGLELDSAEVRGILLYNNSEWGR